MAEGADALLKALLDGQRAQSEHLKRIEGRLGRLETKAAAPDRKRLAFNAPVGE